MVCIYITMPVVPVQDPETNITYKSIAEAMRETGKSRNAVSSTFTRINDVKEDIAPEVALANEIDEIGEIEEDEDRHIALANKKMWERYLESSKPSPIYLVDYFKSIISAFNEGKSVREIRDMMKEMINRASRRYMKGIYMVYSLTLSEITEENKEEWPLVAGLSVDELYADLSSEYEDITFVIIDSTET
jgi:hypothetical protein